MKVLVTGVKGQLGYDVVKELDLANILLETDSPYLTPEPYRGSRNNPSMVYYVAEKISELKNVKLDEIISKTSANAIRLFDLHL